MNLKERLNKVNLARKAYLAECDMLYKEQGILMTDKYTSFENHVAQGIEKIEQLENAKIEIKYSDYASGLVRKIVTTEVGSFFQLGQMTGAPDFLKAREVHENNK